jgi:hypothetical protein
VIKIYQTAQISAQELLAKARENEPKITRDLKKIALEVSGEMFGLEHKFKTEESLIRKLAEYAGDDFQKLKRKTKSVNDVLRYTFILSFDKYADSFYQTLKILDKFGYQIPERRIWNAWENIGTEFDKGYRGINITIISFRKQKFELQFHTKESCGLKTETHNLYKEIRDKSISNRRETEITELMLKTAEKVRRPEGV